ncbi:MAG: FAD-dependent oxidoreductase [Bacteroidales bacterium]|nr:FAD-dependent oxidoreductase [Bacteroidales bacterium]
MDIIIGAGISGLSYAAASQGDYLIIEQEDRIGGYCKTIKQEGFVWDYSGHFFHFQHPEIRDYVMERIAADEMLNVEKHTQIYYADRLVDFPFQMNIHQLPQEEFIDCLYDLFTISPTAENDLHSFKSMLYAKFGRSIAEKFLIPYNTKLYATDLDKLDIDAMGRFFPYADREQIVRNFRHPETRSYNASFLYPKEGCERIVKSIASHVDPARIALGETVSSIDTATHTVYTSRRTLHYDRLISTMPLPRLLESCSIAVPEGIYTWNKVLVFNLGFDRKGKETRNCWIYFPQRDLVFYRVGFYDNIIGQDRMSLYVEIGFPQKQANLNIAELREQTLDDLQRVGIVAPDQQLVAEHHVVMNPAYVHITKQSEADKQQRFAQLAESQVYSIGRYGEWKYCSLEDNIFDAFALAKRLATR